ncbi:MAG: hypothetical protein ACREFN_18510, partial [Acetobacteraceae bacterium]
GYVSPRTLWSVTLTAIKSGHHYSTTYYVPLSRFFDINYDIYVPYVTTALAVVVLRGSLFKNAIEARVTWFAILYCAGYAFAVLILRMNIVAWPFYLSHLAIVSYLTVPVVLGHARATSGRLRAGLFGLGLLVPLAVLRLWPVLALRIAGMAHGSPRTVVVISLVAIAAALLLAVGRRRAATLVALFMAAAVMQAPLLFGPYLDMYVNSSARAAEAPLYKMIRQYRALLDQYDMPGQRVRTWYGTDPDWLFRSLASSNLLFTVQDTAKFHFGMPEITQYERRTLADPDTRYVLLVARREMSVEEGVAALGAAGIKVDRVKSDFWGEPPFTAHALLVRIVRHDANSAAKPQ